ncbi:MAG: T9SS type A sorting domain-containing protein, partial [Ignavibacteria bacterium]|nr:T9SS type A sorting domain-containing protein [Ignavibacteria bacterium]
VSDHFALMQNYPNPFNPSTTIKYSVPVVDAYYASTRLVQLKVYDALGREVATLVNEEKQPGTYEVEFNVETLHLSRRGLAKSNGVSLSSGVYYYQLSADNYNEVKKLLFIK